jgi:hypothetical protein
VTTFGIIIIKHHGVYTQVYNFRLLDLQSSNEQGLKQSTEQKNSRPGKCIEKAFHSMGRSHLIHIGLNAASIARVFGKLIEISQMAAGTIDHKAQDLFEKLENRNTFFVLADRAEKPVYQRKNLNLMQIGQKKRQSGSTGESVTGDFDAANFQFIFSVIFVILIHRVLHLVGLAMLANTVMGFNKHYSTLSKG